MNKQTKLAILLSSLIVAYAIQVNACEDVKVQPTPTPTSTPEPSETPLLTTQL